MLGPLSEMVELAVGVDPSSVVPTDLYVINEFFTREVAQQIGKFDVVIANNVFAHIPDLREATLAVRDCLDGVFVFEAHYLGAMISGLQYDVIYHEHFYYHSLIALEKHFARVGMTIFDVEPVAAHAGSMRYYVCKGPRLPSPRVHDLRDAEIAQGLDRKETFERFARRADNHRRELSGAVDAMTTKGRKLAGYGASGRANTLIQYAGLDVPYIIDDSPARIGKFTPGSHIPICSRAVLERLQPDCLLLFAWSYQKEIEAKCGQDMLIPFPMIHVKEGRRAAA
jgi:methylation protein EvaC